MTQSLGTSKANVDRAEAELGARFPEALRDAYLVANKALEIKPRQEVWWTYPIFDPENVAKTVGHIVYENAEAKTWSGFPDDAITIASNNSGDHLILRVVDGRADGVLCIWDHETRKATALKADVGLVLEAAREYATRIAMLQSRGRRQS